MLEIVSVETGGEIPDGIIETLSKHATREKSERAARMRHRRDAVNALAGEIIVRNTICGHMGLAPDELIIQPDRYGKPYPANAPGIHFNISHSGDIVVCALSDAPVGVDIEVFRAVKPGVAKRFFSDDENEFISLGGINPDMAFFKIWTMKESYVKWEGRGLSALLDTFSVLEIKRKGSPVFHYVDIRPDACCHVCSGASLISSQISYTLGDFITVIS